MLINARILVTSVTDCEGPMKRKQKRIYQKKCEQCGRMFWAARAIAMYCSGRCKVAAHRERQYDAGVYAAIEQMVSETNLGKMAQKARAI